MKAPVVLGLGTALPERCYTQEEIYYLLSPYFNENPRSRAIFENIGVGSRYLAVDGTFYQEDRTTQARNERYMEEAMALGEQAILKCLEKSSTSLDAVTDFIIVSCTGIDTPGLDLRLAGKLGFPPWLYRTNVLGMGCYGVFPGLLRAREAAMSHFDRKALVLAVEICSLHFQAGDGSMENIISSALFSDGAAAALIGSGKERH